MHKKASGFRGFFFYGKIYVPEFKRISTANCITIWTKAAWRFVDDGVPMSIMEIWYNSEQNEFPRNLFFADA